MKQYNVNEIDGLGTGPQFEKRMHFYVPLDVILVELKNCSNEEMEGVHDLGCVDRPFLRLVEIPIIDSRIEYVDGDGIQ